MKRKARFLKINKNRYNDFIQRGFSDNEILKVVSGKVGVKYLELKII